MFFFNNKHVLLDVLCSMLRSANENNINIHYKTDNLWRNEIFIDLKLSYKFDLIHNFTDKNGFHFDKRKKKAISSLLILSHFSFLDQDLAASNKHEGNKRQPLKLNLN